MKKLSQFLKSHISGTPEAILLKFGMWGKARPQQKSSCFIKAAQSYGGAKNCVFILPVNILMSVTRWLLGTHNTR